MQVKTTEKGDLFMPINIPDYHKTPKTLHVNCEKPRAYFVPYSTREAALGDNRDESVYFKSLCGVWDFKFYSSVHDICDFTEAGFDRTGMDKLAGVQIGLAIAHGRATIQHNITP
jgi:hypothetical protein